MLKTATGYYWFSPIPEEPEVYYKGPKNTLMVLISLFTGQFVCLLITCNVYPGSQVNATTSLTIYLSPVLIPLAGIIGSGQVVRPTATKMEKNHQFVFSYN